MSFITFHRNRITDHYVLLTLAAILTAGCQPTDRLTDDREPDYELAQDIVVDLWKERFDYITNGAAKALGEYSLHEVGYDELKTCKHAQGVRPIGCYRCSGDKVLVDRRLTALKKECVFAHELIHLLSWHDFADVQSDHSDPALWNEFGDDTVEAVACRRLAGAI